MKVKYDFRNGQRYLKILGSTEDESEFLRNFFKSPLEIKTHLAPGNETYELELILSKGM